MPEFTVLIPTHEHEETLRYSVASVQWQTRQDFEMFIVGDGVTDRTRSIVSELMQSDTRIRFFDYPKGERNGERSRHDALRQASGRFVCYQSDDDLWLPEHLQTMADVLENHDLAHTIQIEVTPEATVHAQYFDASTDPQGIGKMERRQGGFGLCCGGHTLAAYRRLPHGWMPAPKHMASDSHFWLQFLREPWCRYASHPWADMLHLSSVTRKEHSLAQRTTELAEWWKRIQSPQARADIVRDAMLPLVAQLNRRQAPNQAEVLAAIRQLQTPITGFPAPAAPAGPTTYQPGKILSLSSDRAWLPFMHSGFHPSEPWGAWSMGVVAQILLPLDAQVQGPLQLHVTLQFLLHMTHKPQSAVEIRVNGITVLQKVESQSQATYTINIPAEVYRQLRYLLIELVPLMPAAPKDLGINQDPRVLGVGLVSMSVTHDEPPVPWWHLWAQYIPRS